MTDPKRLSQQGSYFEVELLRAGRQDAMPAKSGVAILAGLGVVPSTAAAAGATAAGSKLALIKSALLVVSAGSVGGLAIWGGHSLLDPTPKTAATQHQAATLASSNLSHTAPSALAGSTHDRRGPGPKAPATSATPLGVDEATVNQVSEAPTSSATKPQTSHSTPPVKTKRSAPETKADTLLRELKGVDKARSALARGNHVQAARLLDDYAKQFPKPQLQTEATVLRIETLVASGNRADALRLGKAFLKRDPNSPYARRIRSLIDDRTGANPATRR